MKFEMEADDYICALYRAFLRRDPDPVGITACRNLLRQSGDPTMILAGLVESEEYLTLSALEVDNTPMLRVAGRAPKRQGAITEMTELLRRIDDVIAVRKYDIDTATTMAATFFYDPPEAIRAAVMAHAPGSRESYNAQMQLIFERIAGHQHSIEMEGHDSSFMSIATAFPFCLPPKDAGSWTMAYGFFLRCLELPAGARVLEIGFGAGGLTEVLTRGGLDVTAVEIRESNCNTLRNRVSAFGGEINIIKIGNADFIDYPGTYDAIVFYESFHHMPAPQETLAHLKKFLNPGGIFAFGAEPIGAAGPILPFPWGLRMDGGSLGAIREVGWVEFGFQQEFFILMLKDLGYNAIRTFLPEYAHCDVWIARLE